MNRFGKLAVPVLLIGLAGCSGTNDERFGVHSSHQLDQLNKTTPTGTPFQQALTADYRDFAREEKAEYDWSAQEHFARKGLAAAAGQSVAPENLADYRFGNGPIAQALTDARAQLVAMLASDAPSRVPDAAAKAQTQFDCWVEEQDEDWQPKEIAECRNGFFAAMAKTVAPPAPPPAAVLPPPPKAPPAMKPVGYVVFFDFDKSDLTPEAHQNIALAAQALKNTSGSIHVTGYTDTVGSVPYNLKLSLRRSDAVEKELVKDGIPANRLTAEGRGKSDLSVPTADGVREPKNRRATIDLQ